MIKLFGTKQFAAKQFIAKQFAAKQKGDTKTMQTTLGFEIKKTARLLNKYVEQSAVMHDVERMTGTHASILRYLYHYRDEDIFQRDIEKRFSVGRSSVTGVLQLMEKNDLIVRESVPYDARLKRIRLTEKAISVHAQIEAELNQMEQKVAEGLTEEEIQTLYDLLARIQNNMQPEETRTDA